VISRLLFQKCYVKTQTMGEDTNPLDPIGDTQETSEQASAAEPVVGHHIDQAREHELNQILEYKKRGKTRRAVAYIASLLAAGTLLGSAARSSAEHESNPPVATDVSFDQYGKDGHPAPQIALQKSQGGIENITPVPSDKWGELAQQALYTAAKEPSANRIAYGMHIVVKPGTVFLHKLEGSSTFTPDKPTDNGETNKFVVPPDEVAEIENPRFIVTSVNDEPDKPVYIAATLDGNPNTRNRATDINQVYFISVPQVYKDLYNGKEGFLSANGSPVPLGAPTVDSEGNLKFGTNIPTEQLSIIKRVKIPTLDKMKAEQRLLPTSPTAGR
jgi:hypothetical protein